MKILDTIRKLFAKAESARELGSIEEAALFAAKAQELLLKHKLDAADVLEVTVEDDPMGRDDLDAPEWLGARRWISDLLFGIAGAHFVQAIWTNQRRRRVSLVGRQSDREVVVYLTETLVREGKRLAAVFMALQEDRRSAWLRNSFLLGYRLEVLRRIREQRATSEQKGGQHAVTVYRTAEQETEEAFNAMFPNAENVRSRPSYVSTSSYAAGKAAGQSVGIGGIASGTTRRASFILGGGR